MIVVDVPKHPSLYEAAVDENARQQMSGSDVTPDVDSESFDLLVTGLERIVEKTNGFILITPMEKTVRCEVVFEPTQKDLKGRVAIWDYRPPVVP